MENTLEFPGLGLTFDFDRTAFTVFGLPIFWYGIIVAVGFAVGAFVITKRAERFGILPDRAIDALIAATIGGIIGARLYYVIFRWEMYSHDLITIFNLRLGGLAFYGGVIGGALGILLVCRWRGLKRLPLIDLFASAVLISLAIGRWGNFVNVEAFGSNTTAPWGMTGTAVVNYLTVNQHRLAGLGIDVLPCTPVHPTFLYESLWNIVGFVLIALYIKRRRFDGEITLLFLGWYGLGRAFIEGMRIDSLMLGGLRVSQGVAALCFVVSAVLLFKIHTSIKKSGDPAYLALYVDTVQAEQAAEEGTSQEEACEPAQPAKETEPQGENEAHTQDTAPADNSEPKDTAEETKRAKGEDEASAEDASAQPDAGETDSDS